jgi:sugar (pentulose or hexulose) kinase
VSSTIPTILAVDIGTSETKAGIVSIDGRLVAMARRAHPFAVDPVTGTAEQQPGAWWDELRSTVAALRASAADPPAAICCVGQGPTLVVARADGTAARPAMTWMDRRGSGMEPELEQATGLRGWGLGVLPAALWVERHDAAAASAARWYFNAWEWMAYQMSGIAATTQAPGQALPDPQRAARAGLDPSRIPPVAAAGSVLGGLRAGAASELGLPAGIPVVAGTVDSFATFHGAGLLDAGDAVDTGGTSGGLAIYTDRPVEVPGAWVAAAPLQGRWIVGGAMSATGKALDWLATSVLGDAMPTDELVAEAMRVGPGAEGLVFLPYLAGERSPLWDPLARGAFVGLTLSHGRAHLARAVLESAALALRHVALPIRTAGIEINELRITGGTARGDGWNQIKADVLGVQVGIPKIRETALVGAAILGGSAIGLVTDVAEGIRSMVHIERHLEPNRANRDTYDALFEAYVALWPRIAPIVHELNRLPG